MRLGKRISHLLLMIVLCVLIFYVGIYLQIDVSGDAIPLKINETLLDGAGKMFLSRLYYTQEDMLLKEGEGSVLHLPVRWAMNLFPIGNYFNSIETVEVQTEDSETYEMILTMQEMDEEMEEETEEVVDENNITDKEVMKSGGINISQKKLEDFEYLISNFYTVDSSTSVTEECLNVKKLLKKDMTIDKKSEGPKVLIYHTHSQEAFKDSKAGKSSDTIMGMGEYLAEILNEKYKIETLHHEGIYDLIDGELDRSKAYQLAEPQIKKILEENPSIEVVIDLHRDGVKETTHLMTEIEGKNTAQIMFFNGMSRTRTNGDISYLYNPYIEDNLAFSLQMQLEAMGKYPGFTRRIYLKGYRYNMHLMPKTLLIEAGAQTNTVKEMRNSMEFLAEILYGVLVK